MAHICFTPPSRARAILCKQRERATRDFHVSVICVAYNEIVGCQLKARCHFRNSSDVVDKLDDIYNVGTFCQVTEMRTVDDKLRLVLLGHRRIKITDISNPASKKSEEKAEKEQEPDTVEKIVQVN